MTLSSKILIKLNLIGPHFNADFRNYFNLVRQFEESLPRTRAAYQAIVDGRVVAVWTSSEILDPQSLRAAMAEELGTTKFHLIENQIVDNGDKSRPVDPGLVLQGAQRLPFLPGSARSNPAKGDKVEGPTAAELLACFIVAPDGIPDEAPLDAGDVAVLCLVKVLHQFPDDLPGYRLSYQEVAQVLREFFRTGLFNVRNAETGEVNDFPQDVLERADHPFWFSHGVVFVARHRERMGPRGKHLIKAARRLLHKISRDARRHFETVGEAVAAAEQSLASVESKGGQ